MQSFDRHGTCVGFCGPTEERIVIASIGHVDNRIDEALPCFSNANAISETTAIADMSNKSTVRWKESNCSATDSNSLENGSDVRYRPYGFEGELAALATYSKPRALRQQPLQ